MAKAKMKGKKMSKRNVTVQDVSKKLGLKPMLAYGFLTAMEKTGRAKITGTVETKKRGRPSNVYSIDDTFLKAPRKR